MKTFKTNRAAKMAYTKAENRWEAKRAEGFAARDAAREMMRSNSFILADLRTIEATQLRCEKEAEALFEEARSVYEQAKAQNFWVKSYHFGHNPTRDLIAQNID